MPKKSPKFDYKKAARDKLSKTDKLPIGSKNTPRELQQKMVIIKHFRDNPGEYDIKKR